METKGKLKVAHLPDHFRLESVNEKVTISSPGGEWIFYPNNKGTHSWTKELDGEYNTGFDELNDTCAEVEDIVMLLRSLLENEKHDKVLVLPKFKINDGVLVFTIEILTTAMATIVSNYNRSRVVTTLKELGLSVDLKYGNLVIIYGKTSPTQHFEFRKKQGLLELITSVVLERTQYITEITHYLFQLEVFRKIHESINRLIPESVTFVMGVTPEEDPAVSSSLIFTEELSNILIDSCNGRK